MNKVYMLYYIFALEETVVVGIFSTFKKALIGKLQFEETHFVYDDLEIQEYELDKIY